MISRIRIQTKESTQIEAGSVVIAQPFWQDEKYKRSVIMILEHDATGSVGMIMNKQSTLCMHDVLPELETGLPLFYGGPYSGGTISYIHNYPEVPESSSIGNELFLNGNYDCLKEMSKQKKITSRKIKFFAGLVYWNAGELESEAFDKKWWISKITAQELFTAMPEDLWSYELLSNGHVYGLLTEFPDPLLS